MKKGVKMLNGKERAALRAAANKLNTVLQIGKSGITEEVTAQLDEVLTSQALVKIHVLETALLTAREASNALCEATGADPVQCIGSRLVLYRESEKVSFEELTGGAPKEDAKTKRTAESKKTARAASIERNARKGAGYGRKKNLAFGTTPEEKPRAKRTGSAAEKGRSFKDAGSNRLSRTYGGKSRA